MRRKRDYKFQIKTFDKKGVLCYHCFCECFYSMFDCMTDIPIRHCTTFELILGDIHFKGDYAESLSFLLQCRDLVKIIKE